MAENEIYKSPVEEPEEEYTLESILAEYKGNAYIAGERKLSKEDLEAQAAKIIEEMTRELNDPQSAVPTVQQMDEDDEEVTEYNPGKPLDRPETPAFEMEREPEEREKKPAHSVFGLKKRSAEEKEKPKKEGGRRIRREIEERNVRQSVLEAARIERLEREQAESEKRESDLAMSDEEQMFFGVGRYARPETIEDVADEVEETIASKAEKRRRAREEKKIVEEAEAEAAEREPTASEAEEIYSSGIKSVTRRTLLVLILAIVSAVIAFSGRHADAETFLGGAQTAAIVQLGLLLLTVALCLDVFIRGLRNLVTFHAGGDSLAAVACITAAADAIFIILTNSSQFGQPYCAPAIFAMLCVMWGSRLSKSAYKTTFRTVRTASLPTLVTAEWERADEGLVLTKKLGSAQGFVSKSLECDRSENFFKRFAPLVIIVSIVFALITTVFRGRSGNFLHCLSALTAVSSASAAALIFNFPFSRCAKKLASSGAALAGWSGAKDISDAVGLVVKDYDLFPENTLSLGGVKSFSAMSAETVVSYTASLIIASGSGLTHLFGDLLKEYACSIYRVDEFSCYEGGGVGAVINGDRVIVGSAAFMNLMGVRLAPNLNLKTAVFTAINDELAGVFIVNYTPVDMVQNALVSLLRSKIRPLFAVRDFSITPAMIKSKFKISTDNIDFLSFEARYKLSADTETPDLKPSAVMSREGLAHFVEIARRGRDLVRKVRLGNLITAAGAIIGLLIMFVICAGSSFSAGSAGNVTAFLALWTAAVLLVNET
ncbi:MAG: hypothetical protein IKR51_00500 [Oscillospiraceae bacterium]|nr:hypothetical protein [Oscillospiraceae bacterium]